MLSPQDLTPLLNSHMQPCSQTDSSDLLGGFRPVDAKDALLPLLPSFCTLVRRTWIK